ncbi:MAG TPA: glycosyltransferase [Thermoanaerobaculia bacterium]|nr:glycosyltransferase [Thermoanaerobaculia bacterium]
MRLLVVSASAGAGHTRAAQAVEEAARALDPDGEVRHVDVLDFTQGAYKKAYVGSYLRMVDHAPAAWGYLYKASDRLEKGIADRFTRFFDKLEFARFRRFVRDTAPDALVSTHFLPPQVFASAKAKGKDTFPIAVVVTDFDVHAFWVQKTADLYCVASEELRAVLAGRGISEERIRVTGIPIAAAFREKHDVPALRARFGLAPDVPSVLLMGGGAGVGTMLEAARAVLEAGPVQLLAVAGRNAELKTALEELAPPRGSRVVAFGFVEKIADQMAVSDLAVTKSGGLTTAECLAMSLPMVIRDPIPGQEERNCDFVLEAGAGVRANGLASLRFKVAALLADRARLASMREAARRVARPEAAVEVVRLARNVAGVNSRS